MRVVTSCIAFVQRIVKKNKEACVLTLFSRNTNYLEDSNVAPQLAVKPVLLVWQYFSCRAFCLTLHNLNTQIPAHS